MLHWIDRAGTVPWSTGSAAVYLDKEGPTGPLPVAVRCHFGSLPEEFAMLDTGARFTIIGAELLELLRDELGPSLEPIRMSTRLGTFQGTLRRLPIRLVADSGADLTVEGTCLALPQWNGPSILGFSGLLERLRFALEPPSPDAEARLHFGLP